MDLTSAETRLRFTVGEADTAEAVGSGSLPVLGTPRLLAWCEAATCAAAAPLLEAGRTTVGTRVLIEHLAASAVGAHIEVTASLSHRDGRLMRFTVGAYDDAGRLIGSGEVTRVDVDADRFLERVGVTR